MFKAIRFVKKFFTHSILVVWCISVGMIFYWLIVASLKDNKTVFRELWALPEKLDFSNYVNAWNSLNFARYSLNSLKHQFSTSVRTKFLSFLDQTIDFRFVERTNGETYNVLDAKIKARFDKLELSASANNIFSTEYTETNLVPMPMANVMFGVTYIIY